MFRKALIVFLPALLSCCTAVLATGQAVPSATLDAHPYEVGGGLAIFNPDIGSGQMLGYGIWGDYSPSFLSFGDHGLSLEGQVKDINFHRSSSQTNVREVSILAGATYSWYYFQNFFPMASVKVGYGTLDFLFNQDHSYTHDSRMIYSFSGGGQYRLMGRVWLRGDYEYQTWPGLFSRNLHPHGVTIGVAYDFRVHRRPF